MELLVKLVTTAAGLKHPETKKPLTAADVMPWLRSPEPEEELTPESAMRAFKRIGVTKGT